MSMKVRLKWLAQKLAKNSKALSFTVILKISFEDVRRDEAIRERESNSLELIVIPSHAMRGLLCLIFDLF